MRLTTKLWFVNCGVLLLMAIMYAGAGRAEGFAWGVASAVYWKIGERAIEREQKESQNNGPKI